jgi:carotenoid 1,2-hydratase
VPLNGYAWWYVDAFSDDGQHGLTIIGFVGSVFSPYYAAARRRGPADPTNFCALNVALYGRRQKYWALTERRRQSLIRSPKSLVIGASAMTWTDEVLTIDIEETAIPRCEPLRGRVRLYPTALTNCEISLDAAERHRWRPLAPRARIDVQMRRPQLRWCGSGYFDTNAGSAPLEDDFARWTWSRTDTEEGAAILFDVNRRGDVPLSIALRFNRSGEHEPFDAPPVVPLPRTRWRVDRSTRTDAGSGAAILKTLEDAPFYARSVIASSLLGANRIAMHESLSLDRFRTRWVQTLLPFRMPRAFR